MKNYPEIRKAVYAILAAVLLALAAFQVVTDAQVDAVLDVADKVLAGLALVMAARNVAPAEG